MRPFVLAILAAQIASLGPALADTTAEADFSLRDALPLFEKNRCIDVKDPAGQLFCGDPELQSAGTRLGGAVQNRLSRIADRALAVEENVEWIRSRDLSCGIFDPQQRLATAGIAAIKACLKRETEERIAILEDPDFDCLATNTTAGLLICSDPALAIADKELNTHVLALVAKMRDEDAKAALSEYARWTRDRDRKCDLDDKDNVPLAELSSSEACLADYMNRKSAEIAAAKGDAKKVFGQSQAAVTPDADAVDLCVAQIHSANACSDFLRVNRIMQLDTEVSDREALVTAEVEMKVLSPFTACSPVASNCTGTCWDPDAGIARPMPGSRQSLLVSQRLRIEKTFAFRKTDSGNWRCNTSALPPIEFGAAPIGR
jgi:uncharacterized protein YecT (DUF1311 family)